jgi:arginyl-tRNA synthetase
MKILEELLSELKENLQNHEIFEEIDLKISKTRDFDYQINNLVKYQNHKKINSISENFSSILSQSNNIEKFEITENFFINLKLNLSKISNFINNIEGFNIVQNPKTIIIDYGGPNIGKPLHVGHLRSLNIGRSLKKLNEIVGNKVITDIHLGDWGMPVAQIISFCELNEIDIKSLSAEQLIDIYPKSADLYKNSEKFKEQAQIINKKLNQSEKEVINKWQFLRRISIEDLKKTLNILNHDFDLWNGESSVNHLIEPMIQSLKKEGRVDYDDGALVSTEDVEPKILITKSDGSYLYLTTDLATILDRLDNNDFDTTLYVVDSRQKLHFEQLFKTVEYFNFEKRDFKHVDFGTINDEEGKPFKTRDGGTKKLLSLYDDTFEYISKINQDLDNETIHKLTNTVLTYSDLLTNRKTDYKFNIKKFTNISGKTGIYIQYAQVRAKKILNKSKINLDNKELSLTTISERNLMISLLNLEFYIKQSVTFNEPHHLANYLYEVCNLFNVFYQEENILNLENNELKTSKLLLTKYFIDNIKLVFNSLGLELVDEM